MVYVITMYILKPDCYSIWTNPTQMLTLNIKQHSLQHIKRYNVTQVWGSNIVFTFSESHARCGLAALALHIDMRS